MVPNRSSGLCTGNACENLCEPPFNLAAARRVFGFAKVAGEHFASGLVRAMICNGRSFAPELAK
jgi:hypothetical protein